MLEHKNEYESNISENSMNIKRRDGCTDKMLFKDINLNDECEDIITEYAKYAKFPPIGYFNTLIKDKKTFQFIINLSSFSSFIFSIIEEKNMIVYIQNVFGTRKYEFSIKHLNSSYKVYDALRLGYNSFICDIIPSKQWVDYLNGMSLDKIFAHDLPITTKGFWNKTMKSIYKSFQSTKTEFSSSVSTDFNTNISFLNLETEYNNVLESMCTKKEDHNFKIVKSNFYRILENYYNNVEDGIIEKCFAVDVIVDKDIEVIADFMTQQQSEDLKHLLFGTALEKLDLNFFIIAK